MTTDPDYLTTTQAAHLVRRKPGTLRVWRHRGVGPAYTTDPHGRAYYKRTEIERWLRMETTHG